MARGGQGAVDGVAHRHVDLDILEVADGPGAGDDVGGVIADAAVGDVIAAEGEEVVVAGFAVDPHAMRRRIKTGHDRRMRRQRVRRRRDARFEESAIVRERVEIRRSRRGISVAADVIGARGIESDQENVRVAQRGFSRSARAARQHAGSQCRGGHVPQKGSSHRRRNFKFQISNEKLKMFVETKALLHFSFFI